jgi:hypothetical protein
MKGATVELHQFGYNILENAITGFQLVGEDLQTNF